MDKLTFDTDIRPEVRFITYGLLAKDFRAYHVRGIGNG